MRLPRETRRRISKAIVKAAKKGIDAVDLTAEAYRLGQMSSEPGENNKCYAKSLGNCSGPISKEHFISESILRQMGNIESKGVPWLTHLDRNITPNEFTSKCLCKYHNEFLSPLDSFAGEFFRKALHFMTEHDSTVMVWGPTFERWLLKMLLGLVGTKQIEIEGDLVTPEKIDSLWIRVLFGLEEFPKKAGLYFYARLNDTISIGREVRIETLVLNGALTGLRARIAGIEFYLSLVPKAEGFIADHPNYDNILYRMTALNREEARNQLLFFWE